MNTAVSFVCDVRRRSIPECTGAVVGIPIISLTRRSGFTQIQTTSAGVHGIDCLAGGMRIAESHSFNPSGVTAE